MKSLLTISLILLLKLSTMALDIKTEIIINATPDKVWNVLSNFQKYPNWNPFIKSVIGNVIVGDKIKVRIEPPEAKGMTFKPKVLSFDRNKEFSWLGHLLFPGLFDGKHQFELVDNGDGTTTFIQSENFKGVLVPFFKKQLNTNTRNGFVEMNKKLKELVEEL